MNAKLHRIAAQLDRLQLVCGAPPGLAPPQLKGYRVVKDCFVRCQTSTATYARMRQYQSLTDDTKIFWQYQRLKGWLRPWKVTIIADDQTGLSYGQIHTILWHCRYYRFLTVEIAIDFSLSLKIDRQFIKKHGVFGKSRRARNVNRDERLCYGSRKARKFVRCYRKVKLDKFRVELELHRSLLRDISTLDAFVLLPEVIYPKHLRFVEWDWKRLEKYLRSSCGEGTRRILAGAKRHSSSLRQLRRCLRKQGLVNLHRFQTPHPINAKVDRALQRWVRDFRKGASWAKAK